MAGKRKLGTNGDIVNTNSHIVKLVWDEAEGEKVSDPDCVGEGFLGL